MPLAISIETSTKKDEDIFIAIQFRLHKVANFYCDTVPIFTLIGSIGKDLLI